MRDERARFTLPDLIEVVVALAFIGGLATVWFEAQNSAAQYLGTGAALVWQAIFPLMVIVLLAVVYRKAAAGGGA